MPHDLTNYKSTLFRKWLDVVRQQAPTSANVDQVLLYNMPLLGHNVLSMGNVEKLPATSGKGYRKEFFLCRLISISSYA